MYNLKERFLISSANVECDYAIGKHFLNRIFNRIQKQPANPDKNRGKEIFKNKSAIEIHTLNRTFNRILRFFYPLAVVIHMLQNPQRIGLLLTFLSDILAKRS